MRRFGLGVIVIFVACGLPGCGDDGGESTATPATPQAGLDAVKKLQGLPQTTEKGVKPPAGTDGETKK